MTLLGTGVVAIRTVRDDGILTTRYVTGDHLGGVSVITDEVGTVDERMSYGAFGERRDPATWQPYASLPDLTNITDKGYTGQQQLDAVGLVHMNGRVYDPQIGRFMSADPTVPDPLDGQSFARYAYVENNPLSAVDPSGFAGDEFSGWNPWQHDAVTGAWFCVASFTACYGGTNIIPTISKQTMPSPVGAGETPVPPAPTAPPLPPPPPQQQQQQPGQQQNPCNYVCQVGNGVGNADTGDDNGLLRGNCGTACGGGPYWTTVSCLCFINIGGSGQLRGPRLIEIPTAGAPIGGGPTVGAPKVPGSGGVPIAAAATVHALPWVPELASGLESLALKTLGVIGMTLSLSGDTPQQQKYLNHYTTAQGYLGIMRDKQIQLGSDLKIYMTPNVYVMGNQAQQALQLSNTPIGYFQVPMRDVFPIAAMGVVPNGTGTQVVVDHPVSIEGAKWIPIPP